MPLAQEVVLSEDECGGSDLEPPSKKRKVKSGEGVSAKAKLSSELHTRVLIGSRCTGCKSRCLTVFQAPFLFHKLLKFRSDWAKTHKLDQDVIAAWLLNW